MADQKHPDEKKKKVKTSTFVIILVVSVVLGLANLSRDFRQDQKDFKNDATKMIQDLELNEELGVNPNNATTSYNFGSIQLMSEFAQELQPLVEQSNEILESYYLLADMIFVDLEQSKKMLTTFETQWKELMLEAFDLYKGFEKELANYSPKNKEEKEMIKGMASSLKKKKQQQFDLLKKGLRLLTLDIERVEFLLKNQGLYTYDAETDDIDSADDGFIEGYDELIDEYNTAVDEYNFLVDELFESQQKTQEAFKELLT
ncbi:hypothetical protein ACFL3T_02400 [Patescibacteria group bacterium]